MPRSPAEPKKSPKSPSPKKTAETAKKPVKDIDTAALLLAAVKKIQRSNTWSVGRDLGVVRDSKGKERHSFCSRGAICAVIAGKNEKGAMEDARSTEEFHVAERALISTLRLDLAKYGGAENDRFLISFNDANDRSHAQVLRLFFDTIDRLS